MMLMNVTAKRWVMVAVAVGIQAAGLDAFQLQGGFAPAQV